MSSLKRSIDTDASNLASKIYIRSTKSGKVQKIVREVYLRDDIPCSSKLCSVCWKRAPKDARGQVQPFILSDRPVTSPVFPRGRYLAPDTNVLLEGMDVLESSDEFCDIIIFQTVLDELRNKSLPLYNRLLGLVNSEDKRVHVFFNDFRRETHVVRESEESINDRNDRAVRRAVQWYGEHLGKLAKSAKNAAIPEVVLLTNDRDCLDKARQEGLRALTLTEFLHDLQDGPRLLDMVVSYDQEGPSKKDRSGKKGVRASRDLYPEYYTLSRMMTGVKAGLLHQGTFAVSPYNYLEATVSVSGFAKPLIILGRETMNRAVDGDLVVVEVLPAEQWKQPTSKILEEDTLTKNENPEGNAEEEEEDAKESGRSAMSSQEVKALQDEVKRIHKKSTEGTAQPTARVVGIVKRNWRQYVGHIDPSSARKASSGQGRQQETVFLLPMDKKIPKIRLRTRQVAELLGKRLLVTMDAWPKDSRYPTGHLVRSLGEMETKAAETEAVLLEWDVQYRPFPKTVLDCLPKEGHDWRVPTDPSDPSWRKREDLRHLLICSIDPVGCQDIDDALHARRLPNGNYEVGVHIADVSNFVKPQTAMDTEASIRGTSVYLVDKRIDMLPMLLGTDLCSLRPHIERFAFSVLWEVDEEANIINSRFTKSVIKSREAFSYEQAQLRIDDASQQDELTQGMRVLLKMSKILKQKRMEAGALSLSSPEVKIQMESETSDPIDVQTKQLLDTNSLVEEFMLLANISVARKIFEAFPQTALLRRHAAPPKTNFDELADQLRIKKDMELRVESNKALAESLDTCVDEANPFFNTLIRIMATRCMMSAEYFCSGTQAYPEFRHYGLASEIYTHFTSPIRRYADLVVHRQLAAAIDYEAVHPAVRSRGRLEVVCKNINMRHRNAQMAGRASIAYYVGQALKMRKESGSGSGSGSGNGDGSKSLGVVEDGYVMRVFSNGFVVFVPRFGIESLVRLRDLVPSTEAEEPASEFDAEEYRLRTSGSRSVTIDLFAKVRVRIRDEKDEATGKRGVRMELVETL